MMRIRKLLLTLCLMAASTLGTVTISQAPAAADHQGACWEVWDYTHSEWFFQTAWSTYGWWRNMRYDVYRECENHTYGEYLGNHYTGWNPCYCQPYYYDQGNDVYY
jgi:hypothetical protein